MRVLTGSSFASPVAVSRFRYPRVESRQRQFFLLIDGVRTGDTHQLIFYRYHLPDVSLRCDGCGVAICNIVLKLGKNDMSI